MMTVFRPGSSADLGAVASIQYQSPGASHWKPEDYLQYDFWVATSDGSVTAFLVWRRLTDDEAEILNLAVAPEFRRKHTAEGLFRAALRNFTGSIFLEVRESNESAQKFYKYLGFNVVTVRTFYYDSPPESAIVMKFHSC